MCIRDSLISVRHAGVGNDDICNIQAAQAHEGGMVELRGIRGDHDLLGAFLQGFEDIAFNVVGDGISVFEIRAGNAYKSFGKAHGGDVVQRQIAG